MLAASSGVLPLLFTPLPVVAAIGIPSFPPISSPASFGRPVAQGATPSAPLQLVLVSSMRESTCMQHNCLPLRAELAVP